MKFEFWIGKSKQPVEVKEMRGMQKGIGLMFRSRNASNLLFRFDRMSKVPITSIFVFFPFMAVWLDEKRKVVDARVCKPFELSFLPRKDAKYLIELPLNDANSSIIRKLRNFPSRI